MRTNNKVLEALFDALAAEMTDQLENGKQKLSKEGELVRESPDAATLNVIRQLLKDNGIQVIGEKSDALRSIVNALPFNTDLDTEDGYRN